MEISPDQLRTLLTDSSNIQTLAAGMIQELKALAVPPPIVTPPIEPPPVPAPKVIIDHIDAFPTSAKVYFQPFAGAKDFLAVQYDPATKTFSHHGKAAGGADLKHSCETPSWDFDKFDWHFVQEYGPAGIEVPGIPKEGATYCFIALDGLAPFGGDLMAGIAERMAAVADTDACPAIVFGSTPCADMEIVNAHGVPGSQPKVIGISDPVLLLPKAYVSPGTILYSQFFDPAPATKRIIPPPPGNTPDAPGDVAFWDCGDFEVIGVRCDANRTDVMASHLHFHGLLYDSGQDKTLGGGQGAGSMLLRPKVAFDLSQGKTRFGIGANPHFEDRRLAYDVWLPAGDLLLHNDIFRITLVNGVEVRLCPGSSGRAIGVVTENSVVTVYAWNNFKLVSTYNPVDGNHNQFWRCHPRAGNPDQSNYLDWSNQADSGMDFSHRFETDLTQAAGGTLCEVREEGWMKASYLCPVIFTTPIQWWSGQVLYHSALEAQLVGHDPPGTPGVYKVEQFGIRRQLADGYGKNLIHWRDVVVERLA